jgi:flagellar biogenesis protein FliO
MDAVGAWRSKGETRQKQLQLVETLSLGGKRDLMLVTCAGESFLVGGGLDGVETIVRVQGKGPLNTLAKSLDETWE